LDRNDISQSDSHMKDDLQTSGNDHPKTPASLDGSASEPPKDAEPQSLAEWFRANGSSILWGLMLIGFFILANEYYLHISYGGALMVVVGLGFIIFIHELGHFLVAKWCDVHVTTFSIGFGPALPFCSVTWGETTYKLAMFPLGGYVQMVGQVDGDESSDGDDDPRSYKNKSVWQRMAIISAGVTMNAIFACVAFTAVFLGPGNQRQAAVVAAVDSGKPAFEEGLRTGAEIIRVNNIRRPYFEDLKFETVSTLGKIEIETQRIGVDPHPLKYDITPHQGSMRLIGIQPSVRLQLRSKKMLPGFTGPVVPGSPVAKSQNGFEFDDVVAGVTNPEFPNDPSKMTLPDDPRNPGGHRKDYFEFERRMSLLADKEVTVRVERGPEGAKKTVDIKVPPMFHNTLGVRMKIGPIVAVRDNSAAADPSTGVLTARTTESGQKLEGDVIEKVKIIEPDGKTTIYENGVNLDPVRLPYQLRQWADRLWAARDNNPLKAERIVRLYVKRQSLENAGPVYERNLVVVDLEWDHNWRFDRILPMALTSPEPISELGLAYLVKNQVDSAEDGQLQKDDEILDMNFVILNSEDKTKETGWEGKAIKGMEWASLFSTLQSPEVVEVKLKIKREGKEKELSLKPYVDSTWPLDERDRGLIFDPDSRVEKADNVLQAIEMGFRDTHRSIMNVYMSLRGLAARTISIENIGGPVAITTMAYRVAQYDFWQFVFFLGFISVQLAVLNFLPIPVLDGGHMVFLLYEKLRGKPASEGVRVGATYAGLLLLGCLMIFVLVLDIRRLVGG
jgi:regulator of sigma E protease